MNNDEFGYNNSLSSAAIAGSTEEKKPAIRNIVKVWSGGGGWLAFAIAILVIVFLLVIIIIGGKGEAVAASDASAILAETGEVKSDTDAINASVGKILEEAAAIAGHSNNIKKSAEIIEKEVTKSDDKITASVPEEEAIKLEVVPPKEKPAEKEKERVTAPESDNKETLASAPETGAKKSEEVPSVLNTPVPEVYNSLDKDLYAVFYGDWDGGMIVLLRPGESVRPGFKFANGKTFRPGVHFNVFSLDNVKRDGSAVSYSLGDLFSYDSRAGCWRPKNTSLGTYYWASGNITVRDGYYESAMSILAGDGKIYDGPAKKRANGTTMTVGNIPALNM